ncbi:MAG: CoA-binding protein [Clostridia bacterium]|nr:MAG: CoA-binding protein [Clostridia bacterium]
MGMREDLRYLLAPRSVALIGISPDENAAFKGKPLRYLQKHGFNGRTYLVNPNYAEIQGLKTYPSVTDLPEPADVALVLVPTPAVLNTVTECCLKGIPFISVFTSGFKELGREGVERERQLVELCRAHGSRLVGPNGYGVTNFWHGGAVSPSPILETPNLIMGRVALIAQSGAMSALLANHFLDAGIGLSYVISTGNEADLDTCDFLECLLEDDRSQVICLFLEGVKNPKRLRELATKALFLRKPVITLKVGRSEKGSAVALAHTGRLMGSSVAYQALFRQSRIITVEDIEELIATTKLLVGNMERIREIDKAAFAIVSASGGASALVADSCHDVGVSLPDFSPETIARLKALQLFPSIANPLDIAPVLIRSNYLREFFDIIFADPNISSYGVVITSQTGSLGDSLANALIQARHKYHDKIIFALTLSGSLTKTVTELLTESGIDVFSSIPLTVKAVGHISRYIKLIHEQADADTSDLLTPRVDASRRSRVAALMQGTGKKVLSEYKSRELLSYYGIRGPNERLVFTIDEAEACAEEIGFPVVLKVQSPDIAHKAREGVMRVGIRNQGELREAYVRCVERAKKVIDASIDGVLIQEMILGQGIELLAGLAKDPGLGMMLTFGLGGSAVEVLKEFSSCVLPATMKDIEEMIRESKAFQLLKDVPQAVAAVRMILVDLCLVATELGEFLEAVDMNPVVVVPGTGRVIALDALVVVNQGVFATGTGAHI